MRIIGLTGVIGSGKSTAARYLAELGAEVIDLDKVGHDVLLKGTSAYKMVVKAFGKTILGKNGEIDRTKLGEIVFSDPEALKKLNNIVHPKIDKTVMDRIKEYRRRGVKVVVLEAAAMLEADKAGQADEIWATIAPEKLVLARLKERSGFNEAEAKARIHSQITNEARIKQARVVIVNDGTLDELKAKVKAEWGKLLKRL
ncbi:MAG: dephospho-CoA kinase [Dehalococcoidales bacterium]